MEAGRSFLLLPPVRWALDVRVLDKETVNYKAPESLDMVAIAPTDLESLHKKFVWKFGLLMYLIIYKKLPFSFVEANTLNNRDSESLQINKESIKKFSDHITNRLEVIKHQWNPQFDMFNNCLRGALVRDYQRRARYPDLCGLFQDVFGFFQPTPAQAPTPVLQGLSNQLLATGRDAATRQVGSAQAALQDFFGRSPAGQSEPLRTLS